MRLSIFWRIILSSLVIIAVMAGVNLYALFQLRQLTALSANMATHHYPAIESAKHLLVVLYAQLNSEKKYLVVRDATFLRHFDEEVDEFQRGLQILERQELTPQGISLLNNIKHMQQERLTMLHEKLESKASSRARPSESYEGRRNVLMDRISATLKQFIDLHETGISLGVIQSQESSAKAEAVTEQLVLLALVFGITLAGFASYSILRPLRQLQSHIKQIGQGNFGASLNIQGPSELRDLVDAVNWMGTKLQELDDMKEQFLAHVSHELRTPMASIQEGTHLLLDEIPGPVSQEQRTTLRIMADSSRRLITLISTILDLSKMSAGMMEYRIVPTDIKRVTDMSVRKVQLLADAKHVQLLLELPAQSVWVKGDAFRIEQVLDNLLSNALKFSPDGGIVKILMKPDSKAGFLEVSVTDGGPGIQAEDLPYIFERFFQGRTKAKHAAPGSGLGLALAKNVVEAHGGRIWIESEATKGTTVRFVLLLTQVGGNGMKVVHRGLTPGVLSCLFLFAGCAAWSPAPQFSQPYFMVETGETRALRALAKKLEARTLQCAEQNSCDYDYFMRALLGLYESRDSALRYFEKVIAVAPQSQLAFASKLWIALLEHYAAPVQQPWFQSMMAAPAISESQALLAQASDQLVRDLLVGLEGDVRKKKQTIQQLEALKDADSQSLEYLQRELAERERKMEESSSKKNTSRGSTDSGMVLSLQKQLMDRERKIEELTGQLEALKRIDEETRDKVRPLSSITPPPTALEPTTP